MAWLHIEFPNDKQLKDYVFKRRSNVCRGFWCARRAAFAQGSRHPIHAGHYFALAAENIMKQADGLLAGYVAAMIRTSTSRALPHIWPRLRLGTRLKTWSCV
ncbi:MAG: hypothetical protein ACLUCF_06425 [Bifidobacterium breve]